VGNEWAGAGQDWLAGTLPCLFIGNIEHETKSQGGDQIRCSVFLNALSRTLALIDKKTRRFWPSRFLLEISID
jgi:hypothetical protein